MPLLATYGDLDGNSDSIFSASKRVASYSLDNIAPAGSTEREYMIAQKSSGSGSLKFLEFQNMVTEVYQNVELVLDLANPVNVTEDYNYLQQIKFLGNSIRKAVLFFRTYINSSLDELTAQDLAKLKEIIKDLSNYTDELVTKRSNYNASLYSGVIPPTTKYGQNSWDILLAAMEDFITQISIALFSYKQSSANFQMQGAGRNFYGKKINNTLDIPTMYSRNIKNCPTKYLL